jgi:peroxin-1
VLFVESKSGGEDSDSAIAAATEGCGPADLSVLARQLAAEAITAGQTSVKAAHVLEAARSFIPLLASRAKATATAATLPRWDDVVGLSDAKSAILKHFQLPVVFRALFAKAPVAQPKGILLFGPPGNGKTILAQAAAEECGLLLLQVRGPELLNKYIGSSEKAVRDLFDKAASSGRPTLLFFDEFEALAPKRGADSTGVTDRVVNQLLTFLDGVEGNMTSADGPKVYVIATTTRPDLIDPALLRPGRIEKHVYIAPPSDEDRAAMLQKALQRLQGGPSYEGGPKVLGGEVMAATREVAASPAAHALSSADLVGLVNTAHMLWVHEEVCRAQAQAQTQAQRQSGCADDDSPTQPPLHGVEGRHLRAALLQTRPSLNDRDRLAFEGVYDRYRGKRSAVGQVRPGVKQAQL